ncbi:MAG: hypothetical protein M3T49_05405 [Candidatus Eremiobacteraeota bacterium]|nr:hypothetical protein [Candidatus Eremiobacteraeota bacterium]
MKSGFLPAEVMASLSEELVRRIVEWPVARRLEVSGPPGCGKTAALAARARSCSAHGTVAVICSHDASRQAFRDRLACGQSSAALRIDVGTLDEHLGRWMRADPLSAGIACDLHHGDEGASRRLIRKAATGLLDLSWPLFAEDDFDLDLPFLSRPDRFLDEASELFRWLRRTNVTPQAFEASCASGLTQFYGDGCARAARLLADGQVAGRASRRGREALNANAQTLDRQRRAEFWLGRVLAVLYREYIRAADCATVLCPEDIIAQGLRWLSQDSAAVVTLAAGLNAIIVDDAEDAEPAVDALLEIFARHAAFSNIVVAGCRAAAIDGIGGRRSALGQAAQPDRISMPPAGPGAVIDAKRFDDEAAEADWIGRHVADLLRSCAPNDIAVLARTVEGAAIYASLLRDRGVPVVAPVRRFQAPDDIADWLALGAVVADDHDHAHMLRVLASPLVGLSDASLWALCRDPLDAMQLTLDIGARESRRAPSAQSRRMVLGANVATGAVDRLVPPGTQEVLARFRAALAGWRADCAGKLPCAVLAFLLEAAGWRAKWQRSNAQTIRRLADDAARVLEGAAELQAAYRQITLGQVVASVEGGEVALRPARRFAEAISCDAIVDAKGLCWPHVVVAGVAHERFPRVYLPRAMAFSRKYGLLVRENVAGGAAQTAKFAWYYAKFDAKARYLEEEARALRYGLARGRTSAVATGFGTPPRWASAGDLLSGVAQC